MFICSINFVSNKDYLHKYYGLITYEIIEKNGKIHLNKKSSIKGDYKNINNREIINDLYIICSINKNNQILKIDEEGTIVFFFDLVLEDII